MKASKTTPNPIRIPRPIGTTNLALNTHTHKTEESLNILKNHLYSHYVNTNYQYNGIPLTISQFTNLLSLNLTELNNYIYTINKVGHKLLEDEGKKEIYGVLLNMAISGVLSDRSAAEQQLHILQQSQGSSYAPFVSSEVTKALAQVQSNTSQMVNLIKVLGGNQGINIEIDNSQSQQTNNYLTVQSAHEMIENQANYIPLNRDENALDSLYAEYEIMDMPEVDATKQNYDASREGLGFGKIEDAKTHEDRRAIEYDVDLEDDDNL